MAVARSAQAATVARFSVKLMVRQAPISFSVRKQPMHMLLALSTVQTPTQGEATSTSPGLSLIDYEVRAGSKNGKAKAVTAWLKD